MDVEETILELNNQTCRVCLENHEETHSLFDIAELEEKIHLTDILTRVTNVKVLFNEVAPKRICSGCTEAMLAAFQFVCRVEKSESILREQILGGEKQIEELEYVYDGHDSEEIEVVNDDFQNFLDDDDFCKYEDNSESEQIIDKFKSCSSESLNIKSTEDANDTDICERMNDSDQYTDEHISLPKIKSNLNKSEQSIYAKQQMTSSSWHRCDHCHRDFARLESLIRHIKIAHTYAPPEEIAAVVALMPNPPKEHFSCTHCPRTFARKNNLIRHASIVHNLKEDQDKTIGEKKHIYKRGLCPYCGQSFSQASLVVHIRRHTGETPYKCEDCNKGFPRRQDLTIHQRKHTGERPHVCSVCGKTFARPNKLTRHMRIHTGERPYQCTECDRCFSQSNDLTIHIRRHTGEKPYKCNVCGDSFISGTALKSHRKVKEHEFEDNEVSPDPYEKIRVKNRFIGAEKNYMNVEILDD